MNADKTVRYDLKHIAKKPEPLVCLTAYTAHVARLLDPHVDLLLVGDSLGMVLYGFDDTLSVTLDMMIAHGAAVMRSTVRAVVVVDMPYNTYEESPTQALTNARRVMQETGCQAVKLEGGAAMAPTIRHLVEHGVPVMGHIGLMPQSVRKMGGFKIQGRGEPQAEQRAKDALAVEAAGVFAIVIEGTVEKLARAITAKLMVPTIGIGASVACDGQILVTNDLLGLTPKAPRFAKRYAELSPLIAAAASTYAEEVRLRQFPGDAHCFT